MVPRRWDYFVPYLLGADPPAGYAAIKLVSRRAQFEPSVRKRKVVRVFVTRGRPLNVAAPRS